MICIYGEPARHSALASITLLSDLHSSFGTRTHTYSSLSQCQSASGASCSACSDSAFESAHSFRPFHSLPRYSACPARLLLDILISIKPRFAMAKIAAATGVVGVLVLLAMLSCSTHVVVEAAKIETFNPASCGGAATNTFFVGGNTCQRFLGQGAVRISDVSPGTRVSIHNQQNCEGSSSVAQIYGPGCVVQGATKLQAVWIQG